MSYKKMVLKMPKTESESDSGINDGNIETFKNDPMISLTKEELQNSTDNALESSPFPVVVEFNSFNYKLSDLPDYDHIKEIFHKNYTYWKNYYENSSEADEFFRRSFDMFESDTVTCLRISDFNTTGLNGIEVEGKPTPWNNLVKDRGVSDKPGDKGGSFGIGKDASFACSEMRLVFYNTINESFESAFQGVLKLPSFKYEEENYVGWGYISIDDGLSKKQKALRENISIDPNYMRPDGVFGMDKYLFGFDSRVTNIKEEIILSSINNFTYAIMNGSLEVKANGMRLNKDTIEGYIEEYKGDRRLKLGAKELYYTLKEPTKRKHLSIYDENDVEILIRLGDNLSGRAAMIRKTGMKVFDKKRGLQKNLSFSAAIILKGKEINERFRKFENVEHTKWSVTKSPENKAKHDEMIDQFNIILNQLRSENYKEEIDADGVSEYLPLLYISGKNSKKESLNTKVKDRKKKVKQRKLSVENEETLEDDVTVSIDEDGELEVDVERRKDRNNPNPNPTPNPNKDKTNGSENNDGEFTIKRQLKKKDYDMSMKHSGDRYIIRLLTKDSLKKGLIKLSISGEQDNQEATIVSAFEGDKHLDFKGSYIKLLDLEKDIFKEIEFELEDNEKWNLEVNFYEG